MNNATCILKQLYAKISLIKNYVLLSFSSDWTKYELQTKLSITNIRNFL